MRGGQRCERQVRVFGGQPALGPQRGRSDRQQMGRRRQSRFADCRESSPDPSSPTHWKPPCLRGYLASAQFPFHVVAGRQASSKGRTTGSKCSSARALFSIGPAQWAKSLAPQLPAGRPACSAVQCRRRMCPSDCLWMRGAGGGSQPLGCPSLPWDSSSGFRVSP